MKTNFADIKSNSRKTRRTADGLGRVMWVGIRPHFILSKKIYRRKGRRRAEYLPTPAYTSMYLT